MKEFFENLKKIRKAKDIELEEIAKKTKLPMKYLEEIEEGNLDNLPQGYDRIFFKRYLKEIGEDRDEVWQDFNLFFGKGVTEETNAVSSNVKQETSDESEVGEESEESEEKTSFLQELTLRFNMDKLHLYFWIAVTVIVIGIVGYFAYQQFMFVQNNSLQVKEISIAEQIEEMQKQDSLLTPQMTKNTVIAIRYPDLLMLNCEQWNEPGFGKFVTFKIPQTILCRQVSHERLPQIPRSN